MAKKLGTVSKKTFEKLEKFDYGNLYSIHRGANPELYWADDDDIEIFIGVNRYARLYIIANIRPEHSRTFDFDQLDEAVDWIKRRVEVRDNAAD